MSAAPVPVSPSVAPAPVHASVRLWLVAIAAGAAEALVWLLLPEPPTLAQLGVRFAIYTGLTVLVLALYTGRNAVRWAVAALLGGIGTLSLVVEPVSWLAAGGDPVAFLTAADGPTLRRDRAARAAHRGGADGPDPDVPAGVRAVLPPPLRGWGQPPPDPGACRAEHAAA